MAKKQNQNLSGFSWYIGYLRLKEGDERRHRSRCVHYKNEHKENHCSVKNEKCTGSSHCDYYKENTNKKEHKNDCKSIHSKPEKPKELVSIECSIPLGEGIETNKGNYGFLVKYKNKTMTILVNGNECKYVYPDSFAKGYLKVTPEIEVCINKDLEKAIWK